MCMGVYCTVLSVLYCTVQSRLFLSCSVLSCTVRPYGICGVPSPKEWSPNGRPNINTISSWLVVSTRLKNISQLG